MRILHLLAILCLASCNNHVNENKNPGLPGKEQLLLNDVQKYPDSLLVKETLIQFYREEGDLAKAINETNKALANDTANDRLYFILGILHSENADTLQAISSYKKAIEIYPQRDYLLKLGAIYAESGNPETPAFADKLSKSKILPEQVLYIRGVYHSARNEKEKCIALMDEALKINFTFMDAYREKALALMHLQKYEEALLVLQKAVTLQNSYEEGYYYMGQCLEKLHRENEAVEAYHKALMYDANYTEAKEALKNLGIKTL